MIEFLTHHALASNWKVWEQCLELRKMGAQHRGTSLGQMERTSSPGDSSDNELAVHVVQWYDGGEIIGYARMYPRPNRGNFNSSRPSMRMELERVCFASAFDASATPPCDDLRKLITACIGYARSHDYDVISGYGEADGVAALSDLGIVVQTTDTGITDGIDDSTRTLYRYDLIADDKNSRVLSYPANEDAKAQLETQRNRSAWQARSTGDGHDVLEELEAMFGVDMTACRKTFESENLTLEAV
ncbi:hypothetical protein [Ahrensia sp. R2A130]|uniref:hypothetical protein n=1 Tax=Ahrensia sp. R2A130 TaxID=744979 RepID=UPI0001E0D886|nr:hypothetical protein [Ahrensia sp. R2A130]EFL87923.1 conserved hypothetical protein [Ahrensia sp. R2A130]